MITTIPPLSLDCIFDHSCHLHYYTETHAIHYTLHTTHTLYNIHYTPNDKD